MWYRKDCLNLDFGKPIIAIDKDNKYLLLPHIMQESGKIIGYDWFNLTDGEYNSTVFYPTAYEAIQCYKEFGYRIMNYKITLEEDYGEESVNNV